MRHTFVYGLAERAFKAKDWPRAARLAGDLVELEPECATGWQWWSDALLFAGRHAEAAQAYERALSAIERLYAGDPYACAHTRFNYACLLSKQRESDRARSMLVLAVQGGRRWAELGLADDWLTPLFEDASFRAGISETKDPPSPVPAPVRERPMPVPEPALIEAPIEVEQRRKGNPASRTKKSRPVLELDDGQPIVLLQRLDKGDPISELAGPFMVSCVCDPGLFGDNPAIAIEQRAPDFAAAFTLLRKGGLEDFVMIHEEDPKTMGDFKDLYPERAPALKLKDPMLRRLAGQSSLGFISGAADREASNSWRTLMAWNGEGCAFAVLTRAALPTAPTEQLRKLDFELGSIWVEGEIDFEAFAGESVQLNGDLRLTIDGAPLPGVRGYRWVPINEWLKVFHTLSLRDCQFELAAPLRERNKPLDERVLLSRTGQRCGLEVYNTQKRRPVAGFENLVLESAQVVEVVRRFEQCVKELLSRITTLEIAAVWWREQVRERMWTAEEIATWFRGSIAEERHEYLLLAAREADAHSFDAVTFELLCEGAMAGDAATRLSTLRAIAYLPWQQFLPILTELSHDADGGVRKLAAALSACMSELTAT